MTIKNEPVFQMVFYMLIVNGKPGWLSKNGLIYYSDFYHPATMFLTRKAATTKIFYCKKKRHSLGYDENLNFSVCRSVLDIVDAEVAAREVKP